MVRGRRHRAVPRERKDAAADISPHVRDDYSVDLASFRHRLDDAQHSGKPFTCDLLCLQSSAIHQPTSWVHCLALRRPPEQGLCYPRLVRNVDRPLKYDPRCPRLLPLVPA